jgi:hypothetical protein
VWRTAGTVLQQLGGGGCMAVITLQPLRREGVHGLMCVKLHGCPVSRATPAAL